MKNEIILAFNEVLEDKGLPKEVIYHALESAMVSAYRKSVNASSAQQVVAKIDLDKGEYPGSVLHFVKYHRWFIGFEEQGTFAFRILDDIGSVECHIPRLFPKRLSQHSGFAHLTSSGDHDGTIHVSDFSQTFFRMARYIHLQLQ